jgi:hypothetical protein
MQMSKDLDDSFQQAGFAPDAILSGHAHNYQWFTRKFKLGGKTLDIPYIVAGGGYGITGSSRASTAA